MPKTYKLFFAVLICSCICSCSERNTNHEQEFPNVIYILADDLGYGELGSYGQDLIETPNLDALTYTGMKFTQHYSGAPVCAPARCILLTGQHAGHAHIRGNDEWRERGDVWNYQAMFDDSSLEGQRPLPDSIVTIAEVFKGSGYATGMVGKWGLGAPNTESTPNKQGFDFFYGYNCQRQAHTLYPMHLWRNEEKDILDNKNVAPHTKFKEGADINDAESYADFSLNEFAPTLMHDEALSFISDHKDKPFFLYYASPLPHVPLQAPQRWVDHYIAKLGPEEPYTEGNYFPNQTPRATYAAMISYLDEQVGEIMSLIDELDLTDQTLIMFSSDNGPTYAGGADTPFFKSASPFETVRPKNKGSTNEGGIRVPMIASWPGHITANSMTDHQSVFYDVMPTICDLLGIDCPSNDGLSFLPVMLGNNQQPHDFLYWEFPAYTGQQAVRIDNWKGIRKNLKKGEVKTELYNLTDDPQETVDIANNHPQIVKQIEEIMLAEHEEPTIERFKMAALGDTPLTDQ